MGISDRYIGKQVISGTLYAVVVLSLILVLGNLFKEIRPLLVEQRAPISFIWKLVIQFLPFSFMYTLPWGFLISTLLVFGRLSSDNEITSLRVAGQGYFRIFIPVILIGLCFSGFSYYVIGTLAPRAKNSMKEMLYDAIKENPKILLDPGVVQSRFNDQKVFVESRDDEKLHGLHICQLEENKDGSQTLSAYVHAGYVGLNIDKEKKLLRLKLEDVLSESIDADGKSQLFMGENAEPWHLDFSGERKKNVKANRLDNQQLRQKLSSTTLDEKTYFSYRAELAKRWSLSCACLAFAFIAPPLGLRAQRRENSAGVFVSIGIAVLYFGLLTAAESVDDVSATVSQIIFLTPAIVAIVFGLWMTRRANQA